MDLTESLNLTLRSTLEYAQFPLPPPPQALGSYNNVRICDRTALILDIFSQRAATREGKLQVELAQVRRFYLTKIDKYVKIFLQKDHG